MNAAPSGDARAKSCPRRRGTRATPRPDSERAFKTRESPPSTEFHIAGHADAAGSVMTRAQTSERGGRRVGDPPSRQVCRHSGRGGTTRSLLPGQGLGHTIRVLAPLWLRRALFYAVTGKTQFFLTKDCGAKSVLLLAPQRDRAAAHKRSVGSTTPRRTRYAQQLNRYSVLAAGPHRANRSRHSSIRRSLTACDA